MAQETKQLHPQASIVSNPPQNKIRYCCICGKDSHNYPYMTTIQWNSWESTICFGHQRLELENYIQNRKPRFCSICGRKYSGKNPNCKHVKVL